LGALFPAAFVSRQLFPGGKDHIMAATLEEYRDILIADTFVDLTRLKLCAQQGVPSEIRGEVWKYLLGVSKVTLPAACASVSAPEA
jgi:phosphopantothenate synthetase